MPLRIVSYTMNRGAYFPSALARCVNARTTDYCRCVWGSRWGQGGVLFEGDQEWVTHTKAVEAELKDADVVFIHNGRVAPHHRALLSRKPVITVAEDRSTLEDTYLGARMLGVVLGPQVIPPRLKDFRIVPLPIPAWEEAYSLRQKSQTINVCYVLPSNHDWSNESCRQWNRGRRRNRTTGVLEKLVPTLSIPCEIFIAPPTGSGVLRSKIVETKRMAHVLIDIHPTRGYLDSLEGLARGSVVINRLALQRVVRDAFRFCCASPGMPFLCADQKSLPDLLSSVLHRGVEQLVLEGLTGRRWMQEYWDFGRQWTSLWMPIIRDARATAASTSRATFGMPPRKPPSKTKEMVSVVVASRNEGVYLRRTVDSLIRTLPPNSEVIVVDDGSSDGSCDQLDTMFEGVKVLRPSTRLGISRARNFGAANARGNYIAFSDAHVEVPVDWIEPLLDILQRPEVGAVAPAINNLKRRTGRGKCGGSWRWGDQADLTWRWLDPIGSEPHPVPLLCGCFVAMRRDLLDATRGFDPGMILYGVEDAELSMRLWTFGYQCWVVPKVVVSHRFGSFDSNLPAAYKYRPTSFIHNELRLGIVHFGQERLQRLIRRCAENGAFPAAFGRLALSDVWSRRQEIRADRRYDDDWFFSRFNMLEPA